MWDLRIKSAFTVELDNDAFEKAELEVISVEKAQ